MATITKIRAWYDPGFSEEGEEAPHYGYSLPSPTATYTTQLTPAVGELFRSFKTKDGSWNLWSKIAYIEVTISWSYYSGTTSVIYGWVDSVTVLADTVSNANLLEVQWHTDLWLTYLQQASFKSGHVLRRPVSGSNEPIQGYNPRFWVTDSEADLLDDSYVGTAIVWWALVATGYADGSGNTWIRYYCWPISRQGTQLYGKTVGGTAKNFPTLPRTFIGSWDECLGVDPTAIYGAWIVPFAPMAEGDWSGTGTYSDPVMQLDTTGWTVGEHDIWAFWVSDATAKPKYSELFTVKYKTLQPSWTPTELAPVHVTGFDGSSVLRFPIGKTVNSYDYRLSVSATECYVEIRWEGDRSRMNGTCATMPALPLETMENAWSSYQYSGQRDYEIQSREEASIRGASNIVSGGSTGAIAGGFTPMGAVAGALIGAVGQGIQTGVDLLWYNEATQNTADRYSKAQSAGILIPGGAWDCFYNGKKPKKVTLKPDTYSLGVYNAERTRVGVRVDEFNTSNSSVPTSTGYYQIANLVVGGSIPNEAKMYMSQRMAKGVRLI